jgi:hypothetical protein
MAHKAKERMMILRKLLLCAGAAVMMTLPVSAANAYYIIYYYGPPYGQISGAELYCDNGSLYSSGGIITGVPAYTEYHTGEAPC